VEAARQDAAALDVKAREREALLEAVGREELWVGLDDGQEPLVVLLLGVGHTNLVCARRESK
jgi:hypothetical protein